MIYDDLARETNFHRSIYYWLESFHPGKYPLILSFSSCMQFNVSLYLLDFENLHIYTLNRHYSTIHNILLFLFQ